MGYTESLLLPCIVLGSRCWIPKNLLVPKIIFVPSTSVGTKNVFGTKAFLISTIFLVPTNFVVPAFFSVTTKLFGTKKNVKKLLVPEKCLIPKFWCYQLICWYKEKSLVPTIFGVLVVVPINCLVPRN